ncbi:galactose-3-O-sulfotransferase 2 [Mactra antiquata]
MRPVRIKMQTVAWAGCLITFIYLVTSFTIHKASQTSLERLRDGKERKSLAMANKEFLLKANVDEVDENSKSGNNEVNEVEEIINDAEDTNIELPKSKESFEVVKETVKSERKLVKQPVRHIAFLKVHKTASSTAQNVFLRYGDERNLSFVLAHTKGESGWLNVISYENSITESNIVPAPRGQPFDLLCCHVIYNRKAFESVLPRDTVYIGIVREPISRFQSAIKYFSPRFILKLPGNNPLSIYAKNPLEHEPQNPRQSQTNNRMAVEFGFPEELFPGKALNGSQKDIDAYIKKLDGEFDFIIISEMFDESMVLMKQRLGWETKDVLYVDKNVGGKITNTKKILHEEDHDNIRKFLYLDIAVYNLAMERFNTLVEEGGEEFENELQEFKAERIKITQFCNSSKASSIFIKATEFHNDYSVTKNDCKTFAKHEKDLIQKQRHRMYGTLDN